MEKIKRKYNLLSIKITKIINVINLKKEKH